jgi:hypothetical protein
MRGWQYTYIISVDAPGFFFFRDSGVLRYKIREVEMQLEFTEGLENVTNFYNACRKSTP